MIRSCFKIKDLRHLEGMTEIDPVNSGGKWGSTLQQAEVYFCGLGVTRQSVVNSLSKIPSQLSNRTVT